MRDFKFFVILHEILGQIDSKIGLTVRIVNLKIDENLLCNPVGGLVFPFYESKLPRVYRQASNVSKERS